MANIIDFITDLTLDQIPDTARRTAKRCLVDAVGCMISGMHDPAVRALAAKIAKSHFGNTAIAATGRSTTRAWAAFANTHAATYFDLDDGHRKAQGHPGGVIVPLALMLAAQNRRSGKELITAIVAGYETAVRSALIMRQAGGPRKGSGAWSITGAAAAAAKLIGLSKTELKHALGLAEYYAPQAPQDRSLHSPSSMKEGMAWAAFAAMTAVDLAAAGFDAMTPFLMDAAPCRDIGVHWEIDSVYFKTHACCRFSHPVLDGLTELMQRHGIGPHHIETITVRSFAKALLLGRARPENPIAAMYSIPYVVGCKLVRGAVDPEGMAASSLSDSRILEIADKVTIVEDPELTAVFPEKCLAGISIDLKDGAVLQGKPRAAKGDPDQPYSEDELREKYLRLTQCLPGKRNESILKLLMNIENTPPTDIWAALSRPINSNFD